MSLRTLFHIVSSVKYNCSILFCILSALFFLTTWVFISSQQMHSWLNISSNLRKYSSTISPLWALYTNSDVKDVEAFIFETPSNNSCCFCKCDSCCVFCCCCYCWCSWISNIEVSIFSISEIKFLNQLGWCSCNSCCTRISFEKLVPYCYNSSYNFMFVISWLSSSSLLSTIITAIIILWFLSRA